MSQPAIDITRKKILFFGGKGGVGKTTCASAVALASSRSGRKTLLVSTDPAHSTSDIFERPFSRTESEIHPGLFGLEIDAEFEAERYIGNVKKQIARLFSPEILREAERQIELASTMPGVDEVALFDRMSDLIATRESSYDLIIFDTAPTGHTLRLLRMPELMTSWIEALSKRRKHLVELDERIRRSDEPRKPDPILETLERRREKLELLRARLMQHNTTGFVLVLIPERLPIEETARAAAGLSASNVLVSALVVNRVLPDSADGGFYEQRRAQEKIYRDEIIRRFPDFPLLWIPQFERDVYGLANLERVASLIVPGSVPPLTQGGR